MKKVLALLLAIMMMFSVATVAFAEGETVYDGKTAEQIIDEFTAFITENSDEIKMAASSAGPILKFASFALKFVKVYVKICGVFGVDPVETAKAAVEYFAGILAGDEGIINNPYNPTPTLA